jgi:hypothetical protein
MHKSFIVSVLEGFAADLDASHGQRGGNDGLAAYVEKRARHFESK